MNFNVRENKKKDSKTKNRKMLPSALFNFAERDIFGVRGYGSTCRTTAGTAGIAIRWRPLP